MSSKKDEMEVEFLNQKIKLSLPKQYSEFVELCKQTFYISDERSKNLSFSYIENGEDTPMEEDEYANSDSLKADYWVLSTNEDEEGDGEDKDMVSLAKDELKNKKKELLNEAKKFKKDLYDNYSKIIAEKIKEKNKVHEENIKKIKEDFVKHLKEIENEMNESLNKIIKETLPKKVMNKYEESIKTINNGVKELLIPKINELNLELKKELTQINTNDINQGMNLLRSSIQNCQGVFMSKIKEAECCVIQKVEMQINSNGIKDGITFQLPIKKTKNVQLPNNCVLEINDDDDGDYQVDINLSAIKYNHEEKIEVSFNPKNIETGGHIFTLRIKQGNNNISNESELVLTITQVGDNDDLFA